MPYNRYHTVLMIASNYGLLKDEQLERIPSSTRHSWKKRRAGKIIGLNDELLPPDFEEMARSIATERSFRTMAKGLYVVNRVMKRMLEASKEKKALIGFLCSNNFMSTLYEIS